MMNIVPEKLKPGSHVRVIAPSRSLGIISEDCRRIARARFAEMRLTVSFGKNVEMTDRFYLRRYGRGLTICMRRLRTNRLTRF